MRPEGRRRTQVLRRWIAVGALVVAVLACGYWFWLRDSALVAVEEVEVRGATANAEQVNEALEQVATEMTTLHVDDAKLAQAVAGFPTVASIAADASIPHKLTVTVTERLPVAVVNVEGEPVGVSADGLLLPGLDVSGQGLPEIDAEQPKGGRLGPEGMAQAVIVGGATEGLRRRIEAVGFDEARGGVVIELENGPEARFGGGADAELKWRALATVLLSEEFPAAPYVDVSVPERPVSGG
jgi:cell division protein FtsQ